MGGRYFSYRELTDNTFMGEWGEISPYGKAIARRVTGVVRYTIFAAMEDARRESEKEEAHERTNRQSQSAAA